MTTKKNYGAIYDSHSKLLDSEIGRKVPSFLDQMKWNSNETIMDQGCGTGRACQVFLLPRIEGKNSKIYGVDISKTMIEYAKENYAHPDVEYVQTNLLDESSPLNDLKFDKVFSFFVMFLDVDYRKTLKKIYELLAPGGQLVICDVTGYPGFDLVNHVQNHEKWESHGKNLVVPGWHALVETEETPSSHITRWNKVLEDIGFKIIENVSLPGEYTFETAADCAEFLMAHDPHPHDSNLEQDDLHVELSKDCSEFLLKEGETLPHKGVNTENGYTWANECIHIFAEKPKQ